MIPGHLCFNLRVSNRLLALLVAVGIVLLAGIASIAAEPEPNKPWPALQIPKALVAVGVWGELFRWREALQQQGIEYDEAYRAQNAYHRPLVQMVNMPVKLADYRGYSSVVLINVDAPALGEERLAALRQFVEQGGGLVVLGGFWAYERGAYTDTALAEMLPVEFPAGGSLPQQRAGALLSAPQSSWKWKLDFSSQPKAFYFHNLKPKPQSEVVLNVGDQPAVVAGKFGAGRVVASAVSVNGLPPEGTVPFWEWQDWPLVLGQSVEWAGANRPLEQSSQAKSQSPPITADEAEKLRLGFQPVSDELLARFSAQPTAPVAEILFVLLLQEHKGPAELSPELLSALAQHAQPEWSEILLKQSDSLNPNLAQRQNALELLGATRSPESAKKLLASLDDADIAVGAIAGLRRLGDPAHQTALKKILNRSLSAADFRNYELGEANSPAAAVQGRIAVAAAIALYHLGDAEGLPRMLELHREIRLLRRVFYNAAKRRVAETDPTGIAIRAAIYTKANDFQLLEHELFQQIGPVPKSQRESFSALAQTAAAEEDVLLLAAALRRTPGDWSALAQAQNGILRRLAALPAK